MVGMAVAVVVAVGCSKAKKANAFGRLPNFFIESIGAEERERKNKRIAYNSNEEERIKQTTIANAVWGGRYEKRRSQNSKKKN